MVNVFTLYLAIGTGHLCWQYQKDRPNIGRASEHGPYWAGQKAHVAIVCATHALWGHRKDFGFWGVNEN